MLNKVLSNIKNMGPTRLAENLRTNPAEKIKTSEIYQKLNNRFHFDELGRKTGAEASQMVDKIVGSLLKDQENISEEVRNEIRAMLKEFKRGDESFANLKYINEVLSIPTLRAVKDMGSVRSAIAHKLVSDAQARLQERSEAPKVEVTQEQVATLAEKIEVSPETTPQTPVEVIGQMAQQQNAKPEDASSLS